MARNGAGRLGKARQEADPAARVEECRERLDELRAVWSRWWARAGRAWNRLQKLAVQCKRVERELAQAEDQVRSAGRTGRKKE